MMNPTQRNRRLLALTSSLAIAAAWVFAPQVARAQGDAPPPPPPAAEEPAPPAAAPAPAPAPPAPAAPEAAPAAAAPEAAPAPAPPAQASAPGGYQCAVTDNAGVPEADAHTSADVICHELATQHARAGAYEIRFGTLGGKVLVTLRDSSTGQERRMMLQTIGDLSVAAPRLVDALITGKNVEETQDVNNVVADNETRRVKTKPSQAGAYMGLFGMTGAGIDPGAAAGVDIGLIFRNGRLGLGGHGRAGGIGSSDNKIGYAGLDVGAHYYFSDADIAPFAGGGFQFAYFKANRSPEPSRENDIDGSGFGAFGEVGVEFFRSSHVGLATSLRADLPFFSMTGDYYKTTSTQTQLIETERYVIPISLNAGILFH